MEGKPKQILIADDEQDILEIISYNLTKEGYEVYTAKDGNEAIEKAKQIHPDLIILDIMMPKKDGFTLAKEIKKVQVGSQVWLIFAKNDAELEVVKID